MLVEKILNAEIPSIAAQRIVIAGFFVLAGMLMWWQPSSEIVSHPVGTSPLQKSAVQAFTVQKFTAEPLADGAADIDFSAAEAAWSELKLDAKGSLEINAQTELALSEVIAIISDDAFDPQIQRMAFLLEKQFGSSVSEQIAKLLPALKNYKDIEDRWWDENGNTMPPAYAELFQLQDESLGKDLANKLFSEQRHLANIMLASYHIQNDEALSEEEKHQAIADLQSSFDVGVANE